MRFRTWKLGNILQKAAPIMGEIGFLSWKKCFTRKPLVSTFVSSWRAIYDYGQRCTLPLMSSYREPQLDNLRCLSQIA